MTDTANPVQTVRVVQDLNVVFADAIGFHSFGFGVAKMFLTRFDSDFANPGLISREVPILQIVMPSENFVRTVAFLEHRMRQMVAAGAVSQSLVDESRKFWLDNPKGEAANA